MENPLFIYNTLSRKKEQFVPLHEPNVGMYVCGPTVYGDPHLGHTRPAITFDVLFRYLRHLGYRVRYVRNITDVGHLEHDADEGEDKIEKKARLEQLEPMEVAQYYTNRYHKAMEALNVLPPSIEPHASGHILEQIEYIKEILKAGYAYESNGSVYFDVVKYSKDFHLSTANCRDETSTSCSTRRVRSTDSRRSTTRSTSHCGRKRRQNTSCDGLRHGATDSLDGISNALRWGRNIWARRSTSTAVEWILCSLTMSAKSRSRWLTTAMRRCATGCTTT